MTASVIRNDDDQRSAPSAKIVLTLFGTVADTTWRMFVPTLGGTALGIWADRSFGTAPLWTLIGVTIGSMAAFGLIYLQLRAVRSNTK